ncbi:MAG: hypothetical protein ACYC6L_05530, partial [Anaerolineae bacterium]
MLRSRAVKVIRLFLAAFTGVILGIVLTACAIQPASLQPAWPERTIDLDSNSGQVIKADIAQLSSAPGRFNFTWTENDLNGYLKSTLTWQTEL